MAIQGDLPLGITQNMGEPLAFWTDELIFSIVDSLAIAAKVHYLFGHTSCTLILLARPTGSLRPLFNGHCTRSVLLWRAIALTPIAYQSM